jgi:hypothetical protein
MSSLHLAFDSNCKSIHEQEATREYQSLEENQFKRVQQILHRRGKQWQST